MQNALVKSGLTHARACADPAPPRSSRTATKRGCQRPKILRLVSGFTIVGHSPPPKILPNVSKKSYRVIAISIIILAVEQRLCLFLHAKSPTDCSTEQFWPNVVAQGTGISCDKHHHCAVRFAICAKNLIIV